MQRDGARQSSRDNTERDAKAKPLWKSASDRSQRDERYGGRRDRAEYTGWVCHSGLIGTEQLSEEAIFRVCRKSNMERPSPGERNAANKWRSLPNARSANNGKGSESDEKRPNPTDQGKSFDPRPKYLQDRERYLEERARRMDTVERSQQEKRRNLVDYFDRMQPLNRPLQA